MIVYSLGNFVFDLWQHRLRRSAILRLEFGGTAEVGLELIPVLINRRHQPEILSGEQASEAIKYIEGLADLVTDDMSELGSYGLEVEKLTRQYRREVNWFYLAHLYRYKPRLFFGNLMNSLRRRLGHQ